MAIGPDELNRVSAHASHARQLESGRQQGLRRAFVDMAENIGFPLACGAGAMPAQLLEREITLGAILPFDREFVSDHLYIDWLHGSGLVCFTRAAA